MKKFLLAFLISLLAFMVINCHTEKKARNKKNIAAELQGTVNHHSNMPFDSSLIEPFFSEHSDLTKYKNDVTTIYKEHHYNYLWFDNSGILEFGNSLYNKSKNMETEGVSFSFPYQNKLDSIFEMDSSTYRINTETDLLLTSLFLFYAENVYKGLDDSTTTALEWLLPRKEVSFNLLLDSVMLNPALLNEDENVLFKQYYKLRDVLKQYREIEKAGGWNHIDYDPKVKSYKPGDTAKTILQVRERLFVTGDIEENNQSNRYDAELVEAIKKYQQRNGKKTDTLIRQKLIDEMNVPIGERIKTIVVNMERCRWISPDLINANEFIVVNIPSYKLTMIRDGRRIFESPVIVGAIMTKTVIFSGKMSYIVFSPYWNLPQSIIKNEVIPGIAKNPNYLEKHNMEWNNGQVRQKPGKNNSLGLVKFMFPNSNNIYLHDTPGKSLFAKENRAFSHGCIRVGKPRELAYTILENDPDWSREKIDAAMNSGKETVCTLKNKIPVYIGYFTAWVDENGDIYFYDDIYTRDERLADLLMVTDL